LIVPAATVLIPTHDRPEALRQAILTVQAQRLEDFELFVVGDGVADATRAVIAELAAADRRIRFFDFPKGLHHGEAHRHEALRHATGRIVAYHGDDDVWMENHLETLDALLRTVDFGHTVHIGIKGDGQLYVLPADLANSGFRDRMLTDEFNRIDFTFGGHTLEAYRRLAHGWRPPPPDCPWNDLYVWRQFLAEPWCRAGSAIVPTCICTHSSWRPQLTDRERAAEMVHWRAEIARPEFREMLWRMTAETFARDLVRHEIAAASIGGLLWSARRVAKHALLRRVRPLYRRATAWARRARRGRGGR
jgi:glycosyltransferase involved in cell wall biosynthesis